MSTPDRYILLVQDHTHLIPLDDQYRHDTHVLYNNSNIFASNYVPTGWDQYYPYNLQRRDSEPWMSDTTSNSSGSSTTLLEIISSPSNSSPTSTVIPTNFPSQRNFTGPFPSTRPRTTTVTTNILTTTAFTSTLQTTNTNYVSTSTATQPAALATEATSLLNATSSLNRANFILIIVFGALTILLLILIVILFFLYTRRKRRRRGGGSDRDSESTNERRPGSIDSRRMSMAAPGAMFISQEATSPTDRRHHRGRDSLPRVSQAPLSMNMALSSNPYGEGPSPRIDPALFPNNEGATRTMPLAMDNVHPTRFSRSSSNPESAPWMPRPEPQPTLGNVSRGRVATPIPFPRLNFSTLSRSGTVVRSAGSGSPVSSLTPTATPRDPGSGMILGGAGNMGERGGLERQPSLPLYHRALQEQASHQRERAGAEEAGRLGIPVITGFMGAGARGSVQSAESDFYSGGGNHDEDVRRERLGDAQHDGQHGDDDEEGEVDTESEEEAEDEKEMEIYDAGIEGSGDYVSRTGAESRIESHAGVGNRRRGEVRSSTRASSGIFPE